MHLALIALPWSAHTRPSAALGALAAFTRRANARWALTTRSGYLRVAERVGYRLYEAIAENAYSLGELFYLSLLYEERLAETRANFAAVASQRLQDATQGRDLRGIFDTVRAVVAQMVEEVARDIVEAHCDVVGFTTCFGQLFGNVLVAQRIKERRPETRIVLGGSTVSSRVGPSLLEEYSFVDYVIQGEGERPLSALLDDLEAGRAPVPRAGLLARVDGRAPKSATELLEVDRLDDLPIPDYDEYADLARDLGIDWHIPIEGSRGCWWDRGHRTGNPKSTCYFCNLNVQWKGYREKTAERVVEELDTLSNRYESTNVYFLDNIIRIRGIPELARGIAALRKDFRLFYEMRANVRPSEIVEMWEAGLEAVQFGIEALSTKALTRMGKGTRTIQNLEVMKTCFELGIHNAANLILNFPGSTEEEVNDSVRAIRRFAAGYTPLNTTGFVLGVDATVDRLRDSFGVTNVRNDDRLSVGLPETTFRRLKLFDLDFDAPPCANWKPVQEAVDWWRERQRVVGGPLLGYFDGARFVRIVDRREDWDVAILEGRQRAVYLYCMQIRSKREVLDRFGDAALGTLEALVEAELMFEEAGRYLSLATAATPRIAAERIRAAAREDAETSAATPEATVGEE
jgi:ribosomal peptide maturation radical SAM protein 1